MSSQPTYPELAVSSLILMLSLIACSDKASGDTAAAGGDTGATADGGGDTGGSDDGSGDDGGTDDGGGDDGGGDDGGGDDGGGDDGGGDDGGEDTPPDPADYTTAGPELPDCTPQSGAGDLVALSGVVLAPAGPEAGLVVYSRSSGQITCVGPDCDTADAEVLCTDGVISPGLINAHDHLQYNVLYPWQHADLYEDRYDWQSDGDYYDYREAYDDISSSETCEIMKWAELRNLVAGATAAVGSSGGSCIEVLVRNLDEDPDAHGLDDYYLDYSSGRVTNEDEGDAEDWNDDLASGYYSCILNHVAEGVNGSVSYEIDHMFEIGGTGEGFGYVHATDATTEQLARMSEDSTAIIWSPRSNLDLYAATTPAALAMKLGVDVVLAPDWTWSGSTDPRNEMTCVDEFFWATGTPLIDREVWEMSTSRAAAVLNFEGRLGTLEVGAEADISVFTWSDTPYRAVIDAGPTDVRLVVIDGDALYGVPDLVSPIASLIDWCETFDACGEERTLCVQAASSGDDAQTYADLERILREGLAATSMPSELDYANDLFPILVCEEARDACDPTAVTSEDTDGDGVADEVDVCPSVYDPLQWNLDGDDDGDFCDPCPLAPDLTDCAHEPGDIDGDGYPTEVDVCPYVYDIDQADSDSDGKGDACDLCPDDANPGDQDCPALPYGVDVLSDESHPDHPPEDTEVIVEGLIVTGVGSNGYFAQDPSLSEYAALWVYDSGDAGDAGLAIGDEVRVTGNYTEYYGLVQIEFGVTEVTGSGSVTPLTVSACDVGTGGADAERYEGMLLRVEGVTVTDSNPDDPSDYGAFVVEDCLWVDDCVFDGYETHPAEGTTYSSITGPLTYSYDENRICPASSGDIVE